jgi:3-hydroxyacyl-CoA dehydrogenase/enoyl-CoA hydratase/3-hydroxybutyryl-CoA epimerase
MSAFELGERDGVATLRFDLPGEKVNLLTFETMGELERRLDEIEALAARGAARTLLIESGKPGAFIAGADVRAFSGFTDVAAAEAAARRGQTAFARLAALPIPAVALIDGACVGGGLELALACRHRVAAEGGSTRLGLPEVQLGILPGFGGTQRLPRQVGLLAALPLLLTGKRISARAARRIGLVDEVTSSAAVLREAGLRVAARGARPGPQERSARAIEGMLRRIGPLRRALLERARRAVRSKTGELYPAPFRILDCVEKSCAPGGAEGFAFEARQLAELIVGPVAQNLVRLYLLSESAPGEKEAARDVERAFVAGAGQMGAAIASLFAGAGIRTRLHDASLPALARGVTRARELLRKRFREEPRSARAAVDRLEASPGRDGLARGDVALEAILEELGPKQALLGELEGRLPERALLATNTSSLDLDRLAEGLRRKERFVGLHFFHPAETMRLVEVVRGAASDEATVARACALAKRLGKTPVIVANRPGFLVNRLLTPYLLEGERLVGEGAPIPALDGTLRRAGMPMGPIELLDEVGLDIALHVGGVMSAAFPDRFTEVGLVRKLVQGGSLGKKSGRGFYVHGKMRKQPSPDLVRPPAASGGGDGAEWTERLLLLVVAEAWRCLEEKVVGSEDELDLAMLLGAGFLIPQGGPTRYARSRGLAEVVTALERLEARLGPRFAAPAALRAAR